MTMSGQVMKIGDLHAQGYSIREISRQTGLSRHTIKKYLRTGPVAGTVTDSKTRSGPACGGLCRPSPHPRGIH